MIFVDAIFENLVLPIIGQEYQAYRIQKNFDSARAALSSQSLEECQRGLSVLRRLCQDNPVNLQEYIDVVCGFVREKAARNREGFDHWRDVVRSALILVCSLPRYDRNNWSYNLDLSNIRLADIGLQRLNFENAVLFDSVFHHADLARCSFKNADLGGCIFEAGSSVEWCDFECSLMNNSYLTHTMTTFVDTRMWGCCLEKARIDGCRVQVVDGYDLGPALSKFGDRIQVITGRSQAA